MRLLRDYVKNPIPIVLGQGRIVEQGFPKELLANGRRFSELYAN